MIGSKPKFSIDLDAELRKVTQHQHLNQVHYLVQLVRHALTHNPATIHIESRKRLLTFVHDGDILSEREWSLLVQLVGRGREGPGAESLQAALNSLESDFGVGLLSLLHGGDDVRLASGSRVLSVQRGEFQVAALATSQAGYCIELSRRRNTVHEEVLELDFYCAGVGAALFFNGKPLNRPIEFGDQLFIIEEKGSKGHGAVGIPVEGDLCRITFYKQGVRLGIMQFPPIRGLLFHGFWNASHDRHESEFRHSIGLGERRLFAMAESLYPSLANRFEAFADGQKTRFKKILFRLDRELWAGHFRTVPLFDSAHRPFSLSLADLYRLGTNFEVIPYTTRPMDQVPAYLPHLRAEDLNFLGKVLNLPLKPWFTTASRSVWRKLLDFFARSRRRASDPPAEVEIIPDQQEASLLRALNGQDVFLRFALTTGPNRQIYDANGQRRVFLNRANAAVRQAVRLNAENPALAPLLKYRLLALAR